MTNNMMKAAALMLTLFVGPSCATERDLAEAEVFVYRESAGSGIRYTYVVKNKSDAPITQLEIGFDYYTGAPELGGDPPVRIGSPSGWTGEVVTMEESSFHSVKWEAPEAAQAIQPGQMKIGFVVDAVSAQPTYVDSHWTVILDGSINAASSRIEQVQGPAPNVDTLPPLLSVSVTPARLWPPNKKLFSISANIVVNDETDPNPTVKLLSVSCNECSPEDITGAQIGIDDRVFQLRATRAGKGKDGRVYSIIYQAEDAAGNVVTATTLVTVPHDQR